MHAVLPYPLEPAKPQSLPNIRPPDLLPVRANPKGYLFHAYTLPLIYQLMIYQKYHPH